MNYSDYFINNLKIITIINYDPYYFTLACVGGFK